MLCHDISVSPTEDPWSTVLFYPATQLEGASLLARNNDKKEYSRGVLSNLRLLLWMEVESSDAGL